MRHGRQRWWNNSQNYPKLASVPGPCMILSPASGSSLRSTLSTNRARTPTTAIGSPLPKVGVEGSCGVCDQNRNTPGPSPAHHVFIKASSSRRLLGRSGLSPPSVLIRLAFVLLTRVVLLELVSAKPAGSALPLILPLILLSARQSTVLRSFPLSAYPFRIDSELRFYRIYT